MHECSIQVEYLTKVVREVLSVFLPILKSQYTIWISTPQIQFLRNTEIYLNEDHLNHGFKMAVHKPMGDAIFAIIL